MRECETCGMQFRLRDPLDNAYDVRIHLSLNPTHRVVAVHECTCRERRKELRA